MIVQLNPSALRETHWYEYLIRFGPARVATTGSTLSIQGAGHRANPLHPVHPA